MCSVSVETNRDLGKQSLGRQTTFEVISLGAHGTVNLQKALLRQRLDVLPALEDQHTPEIHVWWLQQLKSLANPWGHARDWILLFAVSCNLDNASVNIPVLKGSICLHTSDSLSLQLPFSLVPFVFSLPSLHSYYPFRSAHRNHVG